MDEYTIGIKTDESMIENDVECLPNQGTRENLARPIELNIYLLFAGANGLFLVFFSFFFIKRASRQKEFRFDSWIMDRKKGRKERKKKMTRI